MSDQEKKKPCDDCTQDPIGILKRFFVDGVEGNRIRLGQNPALRPVFSKTHGIAHGVFQPLPNLAADQRVGIFAESAPLTAWVRFSSDIQPSEADFKQTCGIAIKVFGVKGEKLFEHGDTQDFILQNHDVFMVDGDVAFCEFIQNSLSGAGDYPKTHPDTKRILREMMKVESSLLSATYWSGLPYAFGPGKYVKYKLAPRLRLRTTPPNDPNYLGADLAKRLREGDAVFDFCVQFQLDPAKQPLEKATVRWEEKDTAPAPVATLTLFRQDISAPGQPAYGQNLSFHPWHSIEAHRPEGSISRARREVYAASAALRRQTNGIPANEPGDPRVTGSILQPSEHIVHAAIYPPIGVARVGNSEEQWFIGPEVADPKPEAPGFYRDSSGALKRQAARFRIYGLNEAGAPVKELTASDADIQWTVTLANKKAAWYEFQLALDIPEAACALPTVLRNAAVPDRESLKIKPKPQKISGVSQGDRGSHAFKDGKFLGTPVYLGELRTDEYGRLIVLGGKGLSAAPSGVKAVTFANNEGWYDDIADGPVTAEVTYQGQSLRVDPAWVVVAPPNYAPQRKSVRTMWDVMRDTAIAARALARPVRPSFEKDIRPIFERLSGLQWVNAGFAASFGWNGPNDLATHKILQVLASNDPIHAEMRRTIANQFRVFDRDSLSPQPWPWIWGDAMNVPPLSARAFTALTPTQIGMLQQWAAGDFDPDYDPFAQPVRDLATLPVSDQPDMLTRAAMEFCLADAFHPGNELTWPMRHYAMYMSPFRIHHVPSGTVEPDYGQELATVDFPAKQGPLGRQFPGGLTRWLGVPWQTDAASCDSGYDGYDPYLPSFWPAHVPNHVMTEAHYRTIMDTKLPLEDRLAAFARREDWMRSLGSAYIDKINNMVTEFWRMGIVEPRQGPGDPDFPAEMEVESLPPHSRGPQAEPEYHRHVGHGISDLTTPAEPIEKKRRFVHGLRP